MSPRRHRGAGRLGLVLILLVAFAAAGAPAGAAEPSAHSQLFTYLASPLREGASPPHAAYPPPFEGFEDPCGIATDSAGDVYVADYYHDVVDILRPDGSGVLGYVTQIAAEDPGDGPCALAVDPAGDLYVDNWRGDVVEYTPSEFPPQPAKTTFPPAPATSYSATVIDPTRATGLAVDPATGDLFVDARTHIDAYEAPVHAGQSPIEIGLGSLGSTPGDGYGLALSTYPATAGDLYVADAASGKVEVFDPAAGLVDPIAEIDGAGTPQGGFDSLTDSSLAVDPTDGHLYVVDDLRQPFEHPLMVVDEFNEAGAFRDQIAAAARELGGLSRALPDAEPAGLAVDSAGDLYLSAGNSEEGALYGFGPTAPGERLEVAKAGSGSGTVTSKPAGISCGLVCAAEFNEGETVTLTATSSATSLFKGFNGGGCNGTGACHLTLTAATKVTATFEAIPQQSLTVAKTGTGTGTVTSAPAGIACGAACSAAFNQGTAITLTPAPASGSAFAGWTVDGSAATCPGSGTCSFTLSTATEVGAEFSLQPAPALLPATETLAPTISASSGPLTLVKASVRGAAATIEADVPVVGTIGVSGPGLRPSPPRPVDAGRTVLYLRLSRRGRAALKAAKRRRLELSARVVFTPSGGAAETATAIVTFKTSKRGK